MASLIWMVVLLVHILCQCDSYNSRIEDNTNIDHGIPLHTHVFKESINYASTRGDIEKRNRAHHNHHHEVVFVIQQKNMDELTTILDDISNPFSPNYGQHWTRDEVADFTSNQEGCNAVASYLQSNGASVISETLAGEYIIAKAPVKVWEKMFDTEFFSFLVTHHGGSSETVIRAEQYSVPRDISKHVSSVLNTIEILDMSSSPPPRVPFASKFGKFSSQVEFGYMYPSKLRAYYNMSETMGSVNSTQMIYATVGQYYSPKNLADFQAEHGSPVIPAVREYGNHANDTVCVLSQTHCMEANLDMEYIMTLSPISPTTFWYADGWFTYWLITVSNTIDPPKVISMSYGAVEEGMSFSVFETFTTVAIKLGTMGVTILASAGDDGASKTYKCGYANLFPASSPYVLSIGGTMVSHIVFWSEFSFLVVHST